MKLSEINLSNIFTIVDVLDIDNSVTEDVNEVYMKSPSGAVKVKYSLGKAYSGDTVVEFLLTVGKAHKTLKLSVPEDENETNAAKLLQDINLRMEQKVSDSLPNPDVLDIIDNDTEEKKETPAQLAKRELKEAKEDVKKITGNVALVSEVLKSEEVKDLIVSVVGTLTIVKEQSHPLITFIKKLFGKK